MSQGVKMDSRTLTSTETDPPDERWILTDEVIGFREVTRGELYSFPADGRSEWRIGSSSECEMQLRDPAKGISRHHATMKRDGGGWRIEDRGSKNGLSIDGVLRSAMPVDPGTQIGMGSLRLVAITYRLLLLRSFLLRLTGWGPTHQQAAEEMIQNIRSAQLRGEPLLLQGKGDLIPIAHRLHRIFSGEDRPFVLHDPSRVASDSEGGGRWKNVRELREAIARAGGGTVCIRSKPLPADFLRIAIGSRQAGKRAPQLIVCGDGSLELRMMRRSPLLVVPLLAERPADQVDQVISEYLEEAAREFSLQPYLTAGERAWVTRSSRTIADVEKCVRRLAAWKKRPTYTGAASLLGMAAISLRQWLQQHPLPSEEEAHD